MRKFANRPVKFTERLVYWLYRGIGTAFLGLPLVWTFRIGQAIGLFVWGILPGYRDLARRNLARAFPEWDSKQIDQCVREHFQTLGANFLCAFVLTQKPWEETRKYFDVGDYERVAGGGGQGRRGGGFGAHIWDLGGMGNLPKWGVRVEIG